MFNVTIYLVRVLGIGTSNITKPDSISEFTMSLVKNVRTGPAIGGSLVVV